MHQHVARKMERGSLAVKRVLSQAIENSEADEERCEFGVIDHLEVQFLYGAADSEGEIDGDHWRRSAKLTCDSREMVAGDGADGAANVDDLGGSEFGGEGCDDFGAGHGELDVTQAEEGMAAEENLVSANRRDSAGGAEGGLAFPQNHARHVARDQMGVVGLRSGGAALRGDESVRLELASKLAEGFGLIAGKDERGFDRLESGSCGEAGAGSRGLGKWELRGGGVRRDALRGCRRLRMNDVL